MVVKTIAALGLAAGLALAQLAGCTGPTIDITAVQAATQAACAFVPTATTIADILAADKQSVTNAVDEAAKIAALICSSVAHVSPATPGAAQVGDHQVAQVTVDGKVIAILGHFVKRVS